MAKLTITLSDVAKKHLKIIIYLLVSGIGGWGIAEVAKNPVLAVVFAPAINYILYTIEVELKNEGFAKALRG